MELEQSKQKVKLGNAGRFIQAYNRIDHSLRAQYNFKRGQSFGDIIRRCTSINSIVRKFEDTLIDYARLRNAIIHGSDEYVIAEPHDDVLENMEKIAELICTPPLVINTVCRKDILIVQADESVSSVISKIYDSGYSNIPVYKGDSFLGVANGQRLIDKIGEVIYKGKSVDDYLQRTTIEEAVKEELAKSAYYELVDSDITIDQALNKFYSNRKLLALILTKNGNKNEPAIGIVTVGDIMDLNVLMDNYK